MPASPVNIGAGEVYTTIQSWEDALANDMYHEGRCKAEAFTLVNFNGVAYTAANYPHLTSVVGAEHDGRAHEVSGAGNARIEYAGASPVLYLLDEYLRISWLEAKGPGNNNVTAFYGLTLAACTIHVHHCLFHNNYANIGGNASGLRGNDADATFLFYRNTIYGYGNNGIEMQAAAAGSAILCNTSYYCGAAATTTDCIRSYVATTLVQANAAFAGPHGCIADTTGVLDYNATSDGSGDDEGANGIANLVTASQFVNPSIVWATTDLTMKAGAGLINEGTSFNPATYPEIDVPITDRSTTVAGTWDIGADEMPPIIVSPNPVAMPAIVPAHVMALFNGHNLYRGVDDVDFSAFVETCPAGSAGLSVAGLGHVADTRYVYALRPVKDGLETPDIACVADFKTDGAGDWLGARPAAPIIFAVAAEPAGVIRAAWQYEPPAVIPSEFAIWWSTSDWPDGAGAPDDTIAYVAQTEHDHAIALTGGIAYWFRLTARRLGVDSEPIFAGPVLADSTGPTVPTFITTDMF